MRIADIIIAFLGEIQMQDLIQWRLKLAINGFNVSRPTVRVCLYLEARVTPSILPHVVLQ